ncbi:hypothetical protein SAMN05216552_102573 [Pseudoduganella namucuonensis]|uniref:Uncharacterized protein n=1 Tax=Pseudoduganella namucuonensis TaxID=1035707 RepID=A0A1I7LA86_9BURK|nr:hypothetical protein SAMN05216552_102573 [Pseudoduganella namucuonensis]
MTRNGMLQSLWKLLRGAVLMIASHPRGRNPRDPA